ncbi:sensor histidine kinase [Aureimonas sp. AU12]|uniref:sensor histidine kinase n=1 Tax=Aureimonas sp. AU12 TaxID=1638161 RepID=UPI00178CEB56|nr:PAS domain-containing sensor histidine kinase [Aureimonas sp. AU12]
MAQRIADHDWSGSPLGPPETWPLSLRTLLNLMLSSRFPMFAAWGPDLVFLYNDAYAPMLGEKEPRALGRRFADVWDDIWNDILPLVESALAGRATWMENLPITMRRNGYPEATYWTFSYSAAHDDAGNIAGMFCACQETTASVESERMLRQREETLAEALEAREVLLEEKDVLLAEVNHRVKNSLQLVVSALSLQSRRIEDPATKAAFAQAITRVRAITSVHERLYRSGDPLVVDMKSYLEGLADDLVVTPEVRTRMQVAVEPVTMRTERAIPLAIIVNELVTNSLKYAYPADRPGPIVLSLRRVDDEMLELTVADQGVGMLAKEETGGGLGTKLVATMASQLGATVERRAANDGFRVSLTFPRIET